MTKSEIQGMSRKALVAFATENGVPSANNTKTEVLIDALCSVLVGNERGRPVDPSSARQLKIAAKEAAIANGEDVKRGRNIDPTSARQLKIKAQQEAIENGIEVKRGRPADPTSKRQIEMAIKAKLRAEGKLKVGRPKAEVVVEETVPTENVEA
jgi:hypothetical protein